jgi:hypothetical protein
MSKNNFGGTFFLPLHVSSSATLLFLGGMFNTILR